MPLLITIFSTYSEINKNKIINLRILRTKFIRWLPFIKDWIPGNNVSYDTKNTYTMYNTYLTLIEINTVACTPLKKLHTYTNSLTNFV